MISKLKAVFDDDRGVSPVIGVILMVAITVILAAVIGTFVLGLGDSLQQAPQAQFSADDAAGNGTVKENTGSPSEVLTISHNGGDAIAADEYEIRVTNTSSETATLYDGSLNGYQWTEAIDGDATDETVNFSISSNPAEFGVGDTVTVELNLNPGSNTIAGGTNGGINYAGEWEVQIIHTPSDSILLDTTVDVE